MLGTWSQVSDVHGAKTLCREHVIETLAIYQTHPKHCTPDLFSGSRMAGRELGSARTRVQGPKHLKRPTAFSQKNMVNRPTKKHTHLNAGNTCGHHQNFRCQTQKGIPTITKVLPVTLTPKQRVVYIRTKYICSFKN